MPRMNVLDPEFQQLAERVPNSMCYWYPKIEGRVPTPKTRMLALGEDMAFEILDDKEVLSDELFKFQVDLKGLIQELGGYPIFMRTDLVSGKHDWERTCYVQSEEVLFNNLHHLIDHALSIDQMPNAIAVREFLQLDAPFKAFRGMPIAREHRFFARKGEIICHHPYWPEGAIEERKGTKLPDGWEDLLKGMNEIPKKRMNEYCHMVLRAVNWSDQEWSVDVCMTKDGRLYVTDMALAKDSWHWPGCEAGNLLRPFRTKKEGLEHDISAKNIGEDGQNKAVSGGSS